jgi:hypothetical protein
MKEEKTLFETIGIQYEEKDGLLYPIFTEEAPTESIHVGKYGDLWMEYLKENHPARYCHLFRFKKLMKKAEEVNEEAYEMLDSIVAKYLEKHPPIDPNSTMEMWQIREQTKMLFILLKEKLMIYYIRLQMKECITAIIRIKTYTLFKKIK